MPTGSGKTTVVMMAPYILKKAKVLLVLLQEFESKGVSVDFVDAPALSTSTPSGKFTLTVLAAVAEFEAA